MEGVSNSTLPGTTSAFALPNVDKWTTLGEIVCESPNPVFTFTYLSGEISPSPTRRFYAQCIRFIPQDQPNATRAWTGGAGAADPMWNNPTNWDGTAPRLDGDDIEFNGVSGSRSIPDGPFRVNSLKFLSGAGGFILGTNFAGPITISTAAGISNLSSNDQMVLTPISQEAVALNVHTGNRTLLMSNTIAGESGFSVYGDGTLYLRVPGNGTNSITGSVLISTGATLRAARHGAIGATTPDSGSLTLDGGTLRNDDTSSLSPFLSENRPIIIGPGGGRLDLPGSSQNLVYNGVITNAGPSGPLFKDGSGRLTFGGDFPNDYDADTIVSAGRLILAKTSSNAIPSSLLVAGSIVQLMAGDQIGDSATVTVAGGILGLQGAISDTVSQLILDGGSITGAVATLSASQFEFRSGTSSTALGGEGTFLKTTTGTVLLSCDNTYTGATTVNDGSLILNGHVGPGEVTVAGGKLCGHGPVSGNVTVQAGGLISPGISVGQLSLTAGLYLQPDSVTWMEINKLAGTNDLLQGMTNVSYGGRLVVTNLAGTLQLNDTFKLFDSAEYTGGFTDFELPPLEEGLVWDTSALLVDGSVKIASNTQPPPPPQVTNVSLVSGEFVMSGSGGPTNGDFYVLATTNLAWPATNWSVIATGQFDATGCFQWTNPVPDFLPQQFFLLQLP